MDSSRDEMAAQESTVELKMDNTRDLHQVVKALLFKEVFFICVIKF